MRIAVGTFSAIMTATLGALLVAATVAAQTPGGTTRYAIMRNGEQVGTHAIEVSCTGPETNIRISTDLIVKVLFVTAYRPCDDPLAHRRNGETYMLDMVSLFLYSQIVRSPRVHSFLRHDATFFAPVRCLNAHGAHTPWRPSPGSNRDPGASKFDGRENMSTTPFFDGRMRSSGRSKPSGALTEASHRSRAGRRKHSETSFSSIALTFRRSVSLLDGQRAQALHSLSDG